MIDLKIEDANFHRVLRQVASTTGATSFAPGGEGRAFMRYQGQQLVRTLVNVTPPRKKPGLEKRIRKDIGRTFVTDPRVPKHPSQGKENVWLFATPSFLFGVDRDYDQRGASVEESARLLYADLAKPTIERAFDTYKPRKQRIKIFRKFLVDQRTLKGLVNRTISHVGRLKAGWLPAWDGLRVTATLQQWIGRHRSGARGRFYDALAAVDNPHVTLINYARGAGSQEAEKQVAIAMKLRAKAMASDMRLIVAGKKAKGWLS